MSYEPSGKCYDRMKYNRCDKSGLLLPAISLGLWHNFGDVDDYEIGRTMVRHAFDHGIHHRRTGTYRNNSEIYILFLYSGISLLPYALFIRRH